MKSFKCRIRHTVSCFVYFVPLFISDCWGPKEKPLALSWSRLKDVETAGIDVRNLYVRTTSAFERSPHTLRSENVAMGGIRKVGHLLRKVLQ
jgi:hypothetical protein